LFNKAGAHAICEFLGDKFSVSPEQWASEVRLHFHSRNKIIGPKE